MDILLFHLTFHWQLSDTSNHAKIWNLWLSISLMDTLYNPDSRVNGANMGPTWVLSAPDGPHIGPMNLAIRENIQF